MSSTHARRATAITASVSVVIGLMAAAVSGRSHAGSAGQLRDAPSGSRGGLHSTPVAFEAPSTPAVSTGQRVRPFHHSSSENAGTSDDASRADHSSKAKSSTTASGPSGRTVRFSAHIDDPGDRLTVGGVDPSCPVGWLGIRGTAHLQGQLRSVDAGAGCVSWDPVTQLNALQSSDGPGFAFAGSIDDHQVGTLDGCGTGSFTMRLANLKVTSYDPDAQAFTMTLTWTVTDGSGTGAFRGASGRGTGHVHGTGSPDLTVPLMTAPVITPNWGTYEGTITCPHHE